MKNKLLEKSSKASKQSKTLLPTHITISEYARLKNVTTTAIYRAIRENRVAADIVGKEKHLFIDLAKFSAVQFKQYKNDEP